MPPSYEPPARGRPEGKVPPAQMAHGSPALAPRQGARHPSPVRPLPRSALPRLPRKTGSGLVTAAIVAAVVLGTGTLLGLQYYTAPSSDHDDRQLAKCLPSLPLDQWAPRPQAWAVTLDRTDFAAGQDISPEYRRSYVASSCGVFLSGGERRIVRSDASARGPTELLEDVFATGPAGMMCYSFTSLYAGNPPSGTMVWYHGGLVKSATGNAAVGEVSQWCHERMGF
jgi:hypothetical protein